MSRRSRRNSRHPRRARFTREQASYVRRWHLTMVPITEGRPLSSRSLRGLIHVLLNTRAARFLGVGVTATAIDLLIFNLAIAGAADPSREQILIANTFAFACATLVGYALNARVTFRAHSDRRSVVRYIAVAIVGAGVYDGALVTLIHATDAEGFVALNLAKLTAVSLSAVWNFLGFTFFAFREDRPETRVAQHEAGL